MSNPEWRVQSQDSNSRVQLDTNSAQKSTAWNLCPFRHFAMQTMKLLKVCWLKLLQLTARASNHTLQSFQHVDAGSDPLGGSWTLLGKH